MYCNEKGQTFLGLSMAGCKNEWKLLCMMRGYHVYKHVWDLYLEDEFTTKHQRRNPHKYAIAILLVDMKEKMVAISFQWAISESSHRSLDCLFPTFRRSEGSNVVFRTNTAEVVYQGSNLAYAQHTPENGRATSILTI